MATETASTDIQIQLFHSTGAWIRSDWPVQTPRGGLDPTTKRLSEVLAHGVVAKCDPKRPSFFEVVLGETWIYFHIAERLGFVYLIAVKNLGETRRMV